MTNVETVQGGPTVDRKTASIKKLETGIPGFDIISEGGLSEGRTALAPVPAGSGKTVFSAQFLVEGIRKAGENGLFVTFEEPPTDIRKNMVALGWDVPKWESEGKWAFVDASPDPGQEQVIVGEYDLAALLARVENGVRKVGATRVSMDSLSSIFTQFNDSSTVRRELFRIAVALKALNVTTVVTVERTEEYGGIARYGVEEFVADNVLILRNVLQEEKRRGTLEVLKYRGTSHQKGEWPFTIIHNQGIMIIPLSGMELKQRSSIQRITSGNKVLDRMCGGGFFRDSVILVSGPTGSGKTLMVTEFMAAGEARGERCLLFAFEDSRDQLFRNASSWGLDYEKIEKAGKLKVVCQYPEAAGLEDHLIQMKTMIEEFKPTRVAVDFA